jgi:hypothetical protein
MDTKWMVTLRDGSLTLRQITFKLTITELLIKQKYYRKMCINNLIYSYLKLDFIIIINRIK